MLAERGIGMIRESYDYFKIGPDTKYTTGSVILVIASQREIEMQNSPLKADIETKLNWWAVSMPSVNKTKGHSKIVA